jgi:hypothetical protein
MCAEGGGSSTMDSLRCAVMPIQEGRPSLRILVPLVRKVLAVIYWVVHMPLIVPIKNERRHTFRNPSQGVENVFFVLVGVRGKRCEDDRNRLHIRVPIKVDVTMPFQYLNTALKWGSYTPVGNLFNARKHRLSQRRLLNLKNDRHPAFEPLCVSDWVTLLPMCQFCVC